MKSTSNETLRSHERISAGGVGLNPAKLNEAIRLAKDKNIGIPHKFSMDQRGMEDLCQYMSNCPELLYPISHIGRFPIEIKDQVHRDVSRDLYSAYLLDIEGTILVEINYYA